MDNTQQSNVTEITVKAVILSIILTLLLTASTIYLGLKVGITISASIPAAVIAMGLFGLFKRSSILESNIVQTTASGGMSLASGAIFCVPALLILNVWQDFNYLETFLITLYGGVLGVLFVVPFRKTLLFDKNLHFPEGTAIGYVLQAKDTHGKSLWDMILGGFAGAFISFGQLGLKAFAETVDFWFKIGKTFSGVSIGFSPVLIGAGYIIGGGTSAVILVGIIIGWVCGVPILAAQHGIANPDNLFESAMAIWSGHIRYIGVGVLLLGGLYTFLTLLKPLIKSLVAMRKAAVNREVARTERDLPLKVIVIGSLLFAIPLFVNYGGVINVESLQISQFAFHGINLFMVAYSLVVGFAFSAVCGYVAGLIGTSASPLSAIGLSSILIVALSLCAILGGFSAFEHDPSKAMAAATLAIIVGVVVISAAAISNDIIQDLKVGYMIGATPWKQQVMQIVGVVVAASIIPPVLQLLYHAYGIGGVYPRAGMDPTASLFAPQAQLMASIAKGVFSKDGLDWLLIFIGMAIAAVTIAIDSIAKRKGWARVSVIAIGIGIYVPIFASSALVLGGLVEFVARRSLSRKVSAERVTAGMQHGFLLSSGLIAGGAIIGIVLAIPFVLYESTEVLAIVSRQSMVTILAGSLVTLGICYWLYLVATSEES